MLLKILLFGIILLAVFWRFYNYDNRWTLQQDQARDVVIGLYAIENGKIPLLGPPSSAGNFSFGPLYYWIIIIFTVILPFINGPWIGFTLLSVFSVVIFFYIGKELGKLPFAVILGLVTGFSSASVSHAPDMLNPMLVGFFVPLSLLAMIWSLQKEEIIYPIILGFAVGGAINSHLQSLSLLPLLFLILLFKNSQRIRTAVGITLGLLISFGPLIYFDLRNQGIWINSIIKYLLVGQNKFNLTNFWLVDLMDFWPRLWGEVITNIPITGYFLIWLFIVAFIFTVLKKQVQKSIWIVLLVFISQIIILKFYKGPRLPVYLILQHSLIVFLVSWSLWRIWLIGRFLGIGLIVSILLLSSYSNLKIINTPSQTPLILALKSEIDNKKGVTDKQVYSYERSYGVSLPLFYLWLREGKIKPEGDKIGICHYSIERDINLFDYIIDCPDNENLIISLDQYKVFDLNQNTNLSGLDYLTQEKIYDWVANYLK